MNKQEFETRIDRKVTPEQFEIINHVYAFHPLIHDVGGKDQIAQLFKLGGMILMQNMYTYVLECEYTEWCISNAEGRIAELQEMLAGCEDRIKTVVEALETYEDEHRRIEEEIQRVGSEAAMLRRKFNQLVTLGTEERMAS